MLKQSIRKTFSSLWWLSVHYEAQVINRFYNLVQGDYFHLFLPGHCEIAKYLLSKGANVEAIDHNGGSPLICAAIKGHEGMVTLLLKHNADVITSFCPALVCSFSTTLHFHHCDLACISLRGECVNFSALSMIIEQKMLVGAISWLLLFFL